MSPSFVVLFILFTFSQSFSVDQCPSFKDEQATLGVDENHCYAFFTNELTFSGSHEFCSQRDGIVPYSSSQSSFFLYKNIRLSSGMEKNGLKSLNFWTQGIFNCAKIDIATGKFAHEVSCSGTRHVACQFEPTSQWTSSSTSSSISYWTSSSPSLAPSSLSLSSSSSSSPSSPIHSTNLTLKEIGICSVIILIVSTLVLILIIRSRSRPMSTQLVHPKYVDISTIVDIDSIHQEAQTLNFSNYFSRP